MAFVVVGQASGIQNRNLRTETWNLDIQDGEDVDEKSEACTFMIQTLNPEFLSEVKVK